MNDETRRDSRNSLARSIWDFDLDDSTEQRLTAYFKWVGKEVHSDMHELIFFIDVIRSNTKMARKDLSQAVRNLRDSWQGKCDNQHVIGFQYPAASSVTDELKHRFRNLNIEDKLVEAVRVVYALDLATDQITAGGGQDQSFWSSSQSLNDVIQRNFPKYSPMQDTQMSHKAIPIDSRNLTAKYLEDHAGVKIAWTTHLSDHLLLEDKTLYVFELACMLEAAYHTQPSTEQEDTNAVAESTTAGDAAENHLPGKGEEREGKATEDDNEHKTTAGADRPAQDGHRSDRQKDESENVAPTKGRYDTDFLSETLMTFSLLFPSRDSAWLKAKLRPRRRWPSYKRSPERDARLGSAEIPGRLLETHKQYLEEVRDTQKLFELYPHWARRWQTIHSEAEAPTPVSRLDKWAQRRRDERHAFKVAYLALVLAIGFGLVATVLGVLQLWVSYCQWQVPDGGHGCGPRRGPS